MWKKYGDRLEFFVVYIREAHPGEEGTEGVHVEQPKTFEQRAANALAMCREKKLSIPTLIDAADDHVATAYQAFPFRAFVIGRDGRVVYGSPTLRMTAARLEDAIERTLAISPPAAL